MLLITLFIAILLELFARSCGLMMPFLACTCFFFSVIYKWKKTVLWMMLAFTIMDLALSHSFPYSLLALPLIQIAASIWRFEGNTQDIFPQIVPGMYVGLLVFACTLFQAHAIHAKVSFALFGNIIVCSTITMPLTIFLLDRLARVLGWRRYSKISRFNLSFRRRFSTDGDFD